jgi:ankyrin repeat protein
LITAASYGELDMVRALLAADADLNSHGTAIPGGGSALAHAVYYGMPSIVDLLVAAGAHVHGIAEHAGVGRIPEPMLQGSSPADLAAALRAATVCTRIDTIDRLLDAGAGIKATVDGGSCLHWAAWYANADSIEHLLARAADPTQPDTEHGMTPFQWYEHRRTELEAINNPDCQRDRHRIEQAFAAANATSSASAPKGS